MRILAIDSSAMVATVAVTTDGVLNAEYTINHKKTHSQTLLPMIDEIKKNIDLDMNTVDAIAIAGGPGSYTGLRIGSATAKGFGLALNIPIINIPTMDALAYNLFSSSFVICPIMDARREQVYTGIYKFNGTTMEVIKPQCIMMIRDLVKELNNKSVDELNNEATAKRYKLFRFQRDVVRERRMVRKDKYIYFIDGNTLLGNKDIYECSVDGIHLTDLGFYRMANNLYKELKEIFKINEECNNKHKKR